MGFVRLLLAFAVLITHSPFTGKVMIPGDIAVQCFFIISGFYMSMILNGKYENSTLVFYKNRFLRLYPVYIFLVFIIISIGLFSTLGNNIITVNSFYILDAIKSGLLSIPAALFLFFSNLTMFFQDLVMFLRLDNGFLHFGNFADSTPPAYTFLFIPQAWSLSLELLFYFLAPLIVKSKKRIVIIMLISISIRLILHIMGFSSDPFSYRFFPSELSVFLLGSLSWHLYSESKSSLIERIIFPIQVTIIVMFFFWREIFDFNDLGRYLFFLFFALIIPYLFHQYKNNKIDRFIGELSYPFYLVHVLCISLANSVLSGSSVSGLPYKLFVIAISSIFSLIFSVFLFIVIQKPIEKIRLRNTNRINSH